jgi:chemotaxis protein MotB
MKRVNSRKKEEQPMARKGKKQEPPENHERWLITYADLITLLLVFFIIMYSMSKIDTEKYTVLTQALNFQFTKADTILPHGQGVIGQVSPKTSNGDSKDKDKEKKEQELQDLLKKVNAYIDEQQLQGQVSATDTPRGVDITLDNLLLFDLGKADLKPASYPILDKLASLLPTLNSTINIEGHTDDLPLATGSAYRDNWGLSNARSLSVLRHFIYNTGLDEHKFISTAYADTKPKVPNDSDENRSKNRRVEIIVLRDLEPTTSKPTP